MAQHGGYRYYCVNLLAAISESILIAKISVIAGQRYEQSSFISELSVH